MNCRMMNWVVRSLWLVLLVGCSNPPGDSSDTTDNTGDPGNNGSPGEIPAPATADNPLLNEVLFAPLAGKSAYVELKMGQAAINLGTLSLRNQNGTLFQLPSGLGQPTAGAIVLVQFDGTSGVDGSLAHAGPADFLSPTQGLVELVDPNGEVLDSVAWGDGPGPNVRLSRGGVFELPTDGSSIGRVPSSIVPSAALEWTIYDPLRVSLGTPNPTAGATVLNPLDGMEMLPGNITLSWYVVPGAATYHLQLSADASFASTLLDTKVAGPPVDSGPLAAGTYYWRVETLAADGSSSGFSAANTLVLDDSANPTPAEQNQKSIRRQQAVTTGQILDVPLLDQKKDTNMLLLESNRLDAGREWDKPHEHLDENDDADNMNCCLASIAMINHYKGGQLSQDRIGFEDNKNIQAGPELDLNYGRGVPYADIASLFGWAMGTTAAETPHRSLDGFFNDVVLSIGNDLPLVLVRPGHAVVIAGWRQVGSVKKVFINDPWHAHRGFLNIDKYPFHAYYILTGAPSPRSDEVEMGQDSDGDGINDFDEINRFGTGPHMKDSDSDCKDDKSEIEDSMFDSHHGWALFRNGLGSDGKLRRKGLTLSGGVPTEGRPELDTDSDGGGLPDFVEDTNGNGTVDAGETDPTNPGDDHLKITGTIDNVNHIEYDFSAKPNFSNDLEVFDQRLHVDVTLETIPGAGKLQGTAHVKYTSKTYDVYRNPTPNCGTQLNIDHPDREWTAELEGRFYCSNKEGKHSIALSVTATPNGSHLADSITYHDDCYSDTQPSPSDFIWGSFTEYDIVGDKIDRETSSPLPTGATSADISYKIHLKMER